MSRALIESTPEPPPTTRELPRSSMSVMCSSMSVRCASPCVASITCWSLNACTFPSSASVCAMRSNIDFPDTKSIVVLPCSSRMFTCD